MKMTLLLGGLLLGLARDASSQPLKIGAGEAASHYDKLMTVTGVVAQVSLRPTIVFINLDKPYPDSPFVAIIHSQNTNQFSDLRGLKGHLVAITGKVINYHDRPEIVLERSTQLVVSGHELPPQNPPTAPAQPASPTAPNEPRGTNDLTTGVM